MAARLSNSTLAACLKPVLRESVNAVRDPDNALAGAPGNQTAKGGNAITDAKKKPAPGSRGERAASDAGLDTHNSGTLSSAFPLEAASI